MNEMNEEERRRHDKSWNDPPLFSIEQMNEANRPKSKPLAKRYSAPLAPEVAGRRPSFGQSQYAQSSFPSQPSPTGWPQTSGYPSQASAFGYGSVPPAPAPLPSYGQAPAQVPAFPAAGIPVQASSQQQQQWPQQQQAPVPQSSNFASSVSSSGYQQPVYPAGQTAPASNAYSYAAPAPYQPPGPQVPANRPVPELGAGAYQQQQQQQGLGVSVTGSLSGPIPAAGLAPNFAASIPHQGRQSVPFSNAGPVHQYPVSVNQPISGTHAPIPTPNYYSNQYQYQ